jgi:hypothetical protein
MMSSRLTVIFYIILCLEIGVVLTVLPWVPHNWLGLGLGDWGSNYFLIFASRKAGYGIQHFVASGWVRGAVTGVGILNIAMAAWEIINFRRTVRALDGPALPVESSRAARVPPAVNNEARPVQTDPLSDYPRRDH